MQGFPPINIAPDITPDMAPPMAKKVHSEADDLVPEEQFIAEHPVRGFTTEYHLHAFLEFLVVNPRRACTARVTVVVLCVCVCVCVSVSMALIC